MVELSSMVFLEEVKNGLLQLEVDVVTILKGRIIIFIAVNSNSHSGVRWEFYRIKLPISDRSVTTPS